MSHIRLFEHPADRDKFNMVPALAITGTLPDATQSASYQGRLSIVNLGSASAEVIEVTGTLPPGSTVTVDNASDEVVVAWPAYQPNVAPIPNSDFEQGDTQWIKGPGWSVVQNDVNDDPNTTSSQWTAKYANQGGNVELRNAVRAAIAGGQAVTATCRVQQGASSAGNAGAAVRLFFANASGVEVMREGNLVDSGSNSEWKTSTLNTTAPADAVSVQIGCRGKRHRQNKPLWVDNFAWNVTQPSVGINTYGTVGPITIRIRDTLGREAAWTGSVTVVPVGQMWNPAAVGLDGVIVDGGTVLTSSGSPLARYVSSRSIASFSDKRYMEFVIEAIEPDGAVFVGFGNAAADLSMPLYLGRADMSWGWGADGGVGRSTTYYTFTIRAPTFTVGDVLMLAVHPSGNVAFVGKNGVWHAGSNPATGAGAINWVDTNYAPHAPLFAMATIHARASGAQSRVKLIGRSGSFNYPVPSGWAGLAD